MHLEPYQIAIVMINDWRNYFVYLYWIYLFSISQVIMAPYDYYINRRNALYTRICIYPIVIQLFYFIHMCFYNLEIKYHNGQLYDIFWLGAWLIGASEAIKLIKHLKHYKIDLLIIEDIINLITNTVELIIKKTIRSFANKSIK